MYSGLISIQAVKGKCCQLLNFLFICAMMFPNSKKLDEGLH
jgi:hypothetical protein